METKEFLKNRIIMTMKSYLDMTALTILENVLTKEFFHMEISDERQLPATIDQTNQNIIMLFETKKERRLKKSTINAYKSTMQALIDYTNKSILKIDTNDVENYLENSMEKGNSNVTLNNQLRNMSAFFTWMRKNKLRIDNPCEAIEKYQVKEKPIDHLEKNEWNQLITGCRHVRDRAILEVLRCTAARGGEIKYIKIKDINWKTGKITIFGEKSNKCRPVWLDEVAMKYLKEYLNYRGVSLHSNEPLFVHKRKTEQSEPLLINGMRKSIKSIGKKAGMDRRLYNHLFRKSTATQIVEKGGSSEQAGEYLGHAKTSTASKFYTFKDDKFVKMIFRKYIAKKLNNEIEIKPCQTCG